MGAFFSSYLPSLSCYNDILSLLRSGGTYLFNLFKNFFTN